MKELALHILDIGHNSADAGATLLNLIYHLDDESGMLNISFEDNGKGMSAEEVRASTDPFFTSRKTRKVGLGLPLLKHTAIQCGGNLEVDSEPGGGTRVKASFIADHIDLPPYGDIAGVLIMLAEIKKEFRIIYTHKENSNSFVFDSLDVSESLGDIPMSNPMVSDDVKEYINQNIEGLRVLNNINEDNN